MSIKIRFCLYLISSKMFVMFHWTHKIKGKKIIEHWLFRRYVIFHESDGKKLSTNEVVLKLPGSGPIKLKNA